MNGDSSRVFVVFFDFRRFYVFDSYIIHMISFTARNRTKTVNTLYRDITNCFQSVINSLKPGVLIHTRGTQMILSATNNEIRAGNISTPKRICSDEYLFSMFFFLKFRAREE